MPELTLNLGYLAMQAGVIGITAVVGLGVLLHLRLLACLALWPKASPAALIAELPLGCCCLVGAVEAANRLAFLDRIGWTPSMFVTIGMLFYWSVLWWPLRVLTSRRSLAGKTGAWPLRAAAVGTALLGVHAAFLEPNWLEPEPVSLCSSKVRGPEIRVVHISDLQAIDIGPRERRLIEEVAAFRPHVVVMTGDYIHASLGEDTAIAAAREVISRLHPSHGVYATTSDSNTEEQALRIFAGLGVHYLINKSLAVEVEGTKLRIGGVHHMLPRWDLVKKGAEPGELFVVGCHTPDLSEACSERVPEADLFLCGHTHGGQVQIPFWGPPITLTMHTPREVAGGGVFKTSRGLPLLLSRGVGMSGQQAPRIRLFCRPHLFLLTLRPEPQSSR